MLFSNLFLLVLAPLAIAKTQVRGLRDKQNGANGLIKHGNFQGSPGKTASDLARRAPISRRQSSTGSCASGNQIDITAPKSNIFNGLTNDEAAAVTMFAHGQSSLNLTAAAMAGP